MTGAATAAQSGQSLPVCEIRVTQELIDTYASLSGDFNPIHVDREAAAAAEFGGTIAHGCIPMEPVFQSLQRWCGADRLPTGSVIRLRYRAPSRPGDVIRSDAQVAEDHQVDGQRLVRISFRCVNQDGQMVIDGECELKL